MTRITTPVFTATADDMEYAVNIAVDVAKLKRMIKRAHGIEREVYAEGLISVLYNVPMPYEIYADALGLVQ